MYFKMIFNQSPLQDNNIIIGYTNMYKPQIICNNLKLQVA